MFKMPYSSKYHGHIILIRLFNYFLIPNGASRLDNRLDTMLGQGLYGVLKGEKAI